MENIVKNISNLTSLWEAVSQPFQTYYESGGVAFCFIKNSQWPNRVWLMKGGNIKAELPNISNIVKAGKTELTFSFFDNQNGEEVDLITQHGFIEKSVQYGMSLVLNKRFEMSGQLTFREVSAREDITIWCKAFKQSFNYSISEETLKRSLDKTSYFCIFYRAQPVGTVILHITNEVAGIHSLGIIPEMRGKGFAKEAMHFILNKAIDLNAAYATLQASGMARKMYEKLGFSMDFMMRNYRLKE